MNGDGAQAWTAGDTPMGVHSKRVRMQANRKSVADVAQDEAVSASPTKKVKRSSGDISIAMGNNGRVLPELLAGKRAPVWPKASTTTQVLTFGASWENRNDLSFLNKSAKCAAGGVRCTRRPARHSDPGSSRPPPLGGRKADGVACRRRHSDPPERTSGIARPPPHGAASTVGTSSSILPPAVLDESREYKRRTRSTGGVGQATRAHGVSSLRARDASLGCRRGKGPRARHARPFAPVVDAGNVDIALSGSPAASVESEFWDDTDEVDESGASGATGRTPSQGRAVGAVLDRLLSGTGSSGHVRASVQNDENADGDARMLEDLLFDDASPAPTTGTPDPPSATSARVYSDASAGASGPSMLAHAAKCIPSGVGQAFVGQASTGATTAIDTPMYRTGREHAEEAFPLSSSSPKFGGELSSSPASIAAAALNPSLWKLVERGDTCPFEDCAFTVSALGAADERRDSLGTSSDTATAAADGRAAAGNAGGNHYPNKNRSRCRHFHTLCGCRHTRGALKGLLFQTNQLDKARNHQKKHAAAEAAAHAVPASQDSSGVGAMPGRAGRETDRESTSYDNRVADDTRSYAGGESLDGLELDVDVGDDECDADEGDVSTYGSTRVKGVITGIDMHSAMGSMRGSRDGRRTWTDEESDTLRQVMEHSAAGDVRKNWAWVAARVCEAGGGRKTPSQCKMRWERILNPGVKKGLWTKEEDEKLKNVAQAMDCKWSHVAKVMGGRTYKQCRERYTNYLKDGLNCGPWTAEEDRVLLEMHAKIGNKWAEIARHLKDRSENMIKNEYMKLSRDASHRRKSGNESGESGTEGKVKKKRGRRKGSLNSGGGGTGQQGAVTPSASAAMTLSPAYPAMHVSTLHVPEVLSQTYPSVVAGVGVDGDVGAAVPRAVSDLRSGDRQGGTAGARADEEQYPRMYI